MMTAIRSVGIFAVVLLARMAPAGEITVNRTEPVIEYRSFDPRNPPAEMPRLHPNEAAVAQSYFGADTRVGGNIVDRQRIGDGRYQASVKIDTIRMTLEMRVTVWLPTDAVPKITNHEEGHRQIAEFCYRNAKQIAHSQAELMMGKTVTGTGGDYEAAANNALKEAAQIIGGLYLGKTDVPCGKAQALYDQITSHGTNAVKEERAVQLALDRAGLRRAEQETAGRE